MKWYSKNLEKRNQQEKEIPDNVLIEKLANRGTRTLKDVAAEFHIPVYRLYKRIRRLKDAGKYIKKNLKNQKQARKQARKKTQTFKIVPPISKEHAAELLKKAKRADEFTKDIKHKTAACDCDYFNDRIGGEL